MISMIPRRLIQTARNAQLDPLARACVANLKLLHPDWEYLFFDDAAIRRFITTEFPQYVAVFDAFRFNIQRIDFFRYLAVHRFGGFYFDLDVLLSTSLAPLLTENAVFPFEELTLSSHLRQHHQMDWEIGNYAFGAAEGEPFLEAVIVNCVRGQRDAAWVAPMMKGIPAWVYNELYVLNTTGPGLLSRTLAENKALAAEVTVLFPDDVCDKNTWHLFGAHGVHLMEGSWRTKGGLLKRRLARAWESWTRKRNMPMSRQLGPTRRVPGSRAMAAVYNA